MSAVRILYNTLALAPNLQTSFGATGGTGPYTFSMRPDGAGGVINPSTGFYTSPQSYGSDVVVATDSLGSQGSVQLMVGNHLQLVCDIIRSEMELDANQVYLWDQKVDIPNDPRPYISVGVLTVKPFANSRKPDGSGSGMDSGQSANFWAMLDINIMSRSLDALNRKEEVLLALNSIYSERQQSLNGFAIARLPLNFVALNEIEGAAILYRFNINCAMQYMVLKSKPIGYYDTFQTPSVVTDS